MFVSASRSRFLENALAIHELELLNPTEFLHLQSWLYRISSKYQGQINANQMYPILGYSDPLLMPRTLKNLVKLSQLYNSRDNVL